MPQNTPEGVWKRVFRENIAILTLVTLLRSVTLRLTNGLPRTLTPRERSATSESRNETDFSSVTAPSREQDISPLLRKLSELEKKLDTLQAKPIAMPSDKEELLNTAMYRVDALEAELISTKKVRNPPLNLKLLS